ncbi:MAG: hypothetical protein Q8R45_13140 [Brevundimonas sp.]|uniref:hypothetical protein n=1 Tax=Brevundimonas sp. TaxID=1871086 RepID=UPI00271D02F4|nr:hypothetical protein [Brevundimonas sp.]MDO9586304.1 hypothetical protein [Brevundimonas sp.]MDP3370278.1 hypothetical protein [Brevundimonas sp.]MDP3657893.1 hypothetical protein [Brevundimonas sp.]MDZ4111337.1 hypothetical protein [Brevundimonas sp.]
MDEETLRERVESWRRRAAAAHDPRERAANLLIASHYAALAQQTVTRARGNLAADEA